MDRLLPLTPPQPTLPPYTLLEFKLCLVTVWKHPLGDFIDLFAKLSLHITIICFPANYKNNFANYTKTTELTARKNSVPPRRRQGTPFYR